MKKIVILLLLAICVGCEEVIDLKLDSQEKQLVVDASLDWEKGKPANRQKIYLSYTNDYYTASPYEKAIGAKITVTASDNEKYVFTEQTDGEYVCNDFNPELEKDYMLSIDYKGKHYTSKGRMREVPELKDSDITQREDGGFSQDKIELKLTFDTKPKDEDNSFLIRISFPKDKRKKTVVYAIDDQFFVEGKLSLTFTGTGEDSEFVKGDELEIRLYRISSQYKQFIDLLNANSLDGAERGRPMFTNPSRVYGNVVYEKDPKQNPFGAFRVAQYSKITYIVK